MNIIHTVLAYLRERQSPQIRILHISVLLLVLTQIVVSNFMGFDKTGAISNDRLEFYATWTHIITGLLILPLVLSFVVVELKNHGLRYFFPYLFGDLSQLQNDIGRLLKLKLPEPGAGGLAAIVQGLGLGALSLVVLSGAIWFLSWIYGAPWAHDLKEIHEFLTGLVEAYIIGHGCMGILHIYYGPVRPV